MIEYLSPIAKTQARLARGETLAAIDNLPDWLPVALNPEAGLTWRKIGAQRLQQPFFADEFKAQPPALRQICHTSPADSLRLLQQGVSVKPCALIFHSSRCGSTLLMQLLACLDECVSISEAPLLEHALHAAHCGAPSSLLELALQALLQRRFAQEKYAIIKTDCWHLAELPLLRAALPHTPMYFLYREPAAVLASHRRQCGPQMIPGMLDVSRLGMAPAEFDFEAWPSHFLQHLFELALRFHHEAGLQLLHYRELPDVLWRRLLPEWEIACSETALSALRSRSGVHAKSGQSWQGEAAPQIPAAPALQEAYEALEACRLAG